jgi:LysM repeat protein
MRSMIICLLVFLLSACALEPASSLGEIELTVIVNTPEPELPTFTPQVVASATQISLSPTPSSQSATIKQDCVIRTDLHTYTVVPGDSLSSIAARTTSRVSDLVEWNCLANANMIVVGMHLQVARDAVPPTSTPSPTPWPSNTTAAPLVLGPFGALGAAPTIQAGSPADWTDFVIDPQSPVTIHWSGIDPEYYSQVGQIEFFYTPDNGSRISIGFDADKTDGMSVTWTAVSNVSGRITATARYGVNGSIIRQRFTFALLIKDFAQG